MDIIFAIKNRRANRAIRYNVLAKTKIARSEFRHSHRGLISTESSTTLFSGCFRDERNNGS